jgi:methionyl-tRNA formyltransferase
VRILLLANNRIGFQLAEWLVAREEDDVVGLVLHPPETSRFGAELRAAVPVPEADVFDGSRLRDPEVLDRIAALKPDIALSLLFGYILKQPFIELFPAGVVNLHPALLPYNRGQYPNVWSIVEGTPSGVTIHYINEGIDTGDVVAQREVEVSPLDTGESLYRKLEAASVTLFQETWPAIRAGSAPRRPQPGGGTSHRTADVETIDEIDLDRSYRARDLLDIIRARTFPPYRGAYFVTDAGDRVYLRLELLGEDEGG